MEGLVVLVAVAVGAAVLVGVAVWALMAAKLRLERQLREQERTNSMALREENERHVKALLEGALERFRTVSNAALKANGEEFRALNAGELAHILAPLKESLAASMEASRKAQEKTGQMEARFGEHMKALEESAIRFNTGSVSFVNAITGANKVAGNWGERVLEQVLDDCGLVKDVHYVAQTGAGGNIPDFQVFDPSNRKILVIDAKVSFKKYKEMVDSSDPLARTAALSEHVASVRNQIDNLASKRYHETLTPPAGREDYAYLPFSAMFIPSDAALWEAVKRDPEIPAYAFKKGVALVTPTALYGFMRLVHESWAFFSTEKNQEKIAHEAELVVERIDGLLRALEEADAECAKTQAKIAAAKKLACDGGTCIRGPALKIVQLHGKLKKPLKSVALTTADDFGDDRKSETE